MQEKKQYLINIAEKISSDENEREIIQYGLQQAMIILLNLVTWIICGILWRELPFALLLFFGVFFLRPYAGGYHADTPSNCYLISTAVMNAAVLGKHLIKLSPMVLGTIWFVTAVFVWCFSPVENPIHSLEEDERKAYARKTRGIVCFYGFLFLIGMHMQKELWSEAILWVQILVGIAMIAGIVKYKNDMFMQTVEKEQ